MKCNKTKLQTTCFYLILSFFLKKKKEKGPELVSTPHFLFFWEFDFKDKEYLKLSDFDLEDNLIDALTGFHAILGMIIWVTFLEKKIGVLKK